MEAIKGYCVLTETISGQELVWRCTNDTTGEDWPIVFKTEREAQLEILDDIENDIQNFKDEIREWDEIGWADQYTVVEIEISEYAVITVYDTGNKVMELTLQQWRENL